MEEIAQRIVNDINRGQEWQGSDSEQKLVEVALTMLEEMDEDTVEECMTTIYGVAAEEYGE